MKMFIEKDTACAERQRERERKLTSVLKPSMGGREGQRKGLMVGGRDVEMKGQREGSSVYSRIRKLPVIFFPQLPMCRNARRGAPQCAAWRTAMRGVAHRNAQRGAPQCAA